MGLFGKSTFLERELEDWCLEIWLWLMQNLGGMGRLGSTRLAMANRDFYTPTEAEGHERALYIFETTKQLMGIADWPCGLEAHDRAPANARVAEFAFVRSDPTPNGTFRIQEGQVIISYASDLVERPRELIATLAHELSHYLVASIMKPMPGGHRVHELTTELTVAFAGFGLFGANQAFEFAQHQDAWGQGWRSRQLGYFSERSWAFGLALFTALKEEDVPDGVLKTSVADLTRKARKYLKRHDELLAPLREIA